MATIIIINCIFLILSHSIGDTSVLLPVIHECLLDEKPFINNLEVEDSPSSFKFVNCCLLFTASIVFSLSLLLIQMYLAPETTPSSISVDNSPSYLGVWFPNDTDNIPSLVSGILPHDFDSVLFEVSSLTGVIDFSKPAVLPTELGQSITAWDPVTRMVVRLVCEKNIPVVKPAQNYISAEDLIAQIAIDDPNRERLIELFMQVYS